MDPNEFRSRFGGPNGSLLSHAGTSSLGPMSSVLPASHQYSPLKSDPLPRTEPAYSNSGPFTSLLKPEIKPNVSFAPLPTFESQFRPNDNQFRSSNDSLFRNDPLLDRASQFPTLNRVVTQPLSGTTPANISASNSSKLPHPNAIASPSKSLADELRFFGDDALDADSGEVDRGVSFAEKDAETAALELQQLDARDPIKIAQRKAQADIDRKTIELIRNEMHDKLNKYKNRLESSQTEVQKSKEEVKKLKELLKEIEREKIAEKENERRAKLNSNSKRGQQTMADRVKYLDLQKAERVKKLMKDIDEASQKHEGNGTAGALLARRAADDLWTQFTQSLSTWIINNTPLSRDVKSIEARFGSGMSSYFEFFQFTFLNSIFLMPIHVYMLIHQIILFWSNITTMVGLVPFWTLYSSFSISFIYICALCYSLIYMLGVALNKWVRSDYREKQDSVAESDELLNIEVEQNGEKEQRKLKSKIAASLFNLWDFGVEEAEACDDMRESLISNLELQIAEQTIEERLANRTQQEKIILLIRRSLGLLLNLVFVVISSGIIVFAAVYQTTIISWIESNIPSISSLASYISPLITSIINAAIKPLTFALTEFEQWDNAATLLKHQTGRLYVGKQANIFINVISFFLIAQQTSIFGLSIAFDTKTYTCAQDYVGMSLFRLMLTEFVVSKGITVVVFLAKSLAQKTCVRSLKHETFSISNQMNDMLYFQLLVWITLPLFPFGCILGTIMLYLNFKFDVLRLIHMSAKSTEVFSSRDMMSFFTFFYTITALATVVLIIYFLNSTFPCSAGPFVSYSNTPWNYVSSASNTYNLSSVYSLLTSPLLYATIGTVLILKQGLSNNTIEALQSTVLREREQADAELMRLQAELSKTTRALEHQRKAAQL